MIDLVDSLAHHPSGRRGDALSVTRMHVVQRLADPYLTDHDRWVLGQFARFLSGMTPEPDPRAVAGRTEQPLRGDRRWPRV